MFDREYPALVSWQVMGPAETWCSHEASGGRSASGPHLNVMNPGDQATYYTESNILSTS